VKDISVIICTRNRSDSLLVTLDGLAHNDRTGLDLEVVVVDNASTDDTRGVVDSFRDRLPLRYLFESELGTYGKSHALNCAIDSGGLGEIVAVIDDDISPHPDWLRGVISISKRWPDKDLFTGKTTIIWPTDNVPGWALQPVLHSWIFSAISYGDQDKSLAPGRWFSGNHFWFRLRVLDGGRRFRDIWLTEPDFMLQLAEDGYQGVSGPDAVVGHRVQPRLLSQDVARELALQVGRCYASLRLHPYRSRVKQAVLFKRHPLWARLFCLANGLRWRCTYFIASNLCPSPDDRFVRSLVAVERFTTYHELLKTSHRLKEYRVFRRNRAIPDHRERKSH